MIAVDTNVLVRIVVRDENQSEQAQQAQQLVKAAGTVYVPQLVQVELVWVLEASYKLAKPDVVRVLRHLLESDFYQLQRESYFSVALDRFEASNAGFSDSLIATESQSEHVELWTFDRKLSKQPGVVRLTEQTLAEYS